MSKKLKSFKARAWLLAAKEVRKLAKDLAIEGQVANHLKNHVAPSLEQRARIIERNYKEPVCAGHTVSRSRVRRRRKG